LVIQDEFPQPEEEIKPPSQRLIIPSRIAHIIALVILIIGDILVLNFHEVIEGYSIFTLLFHPVILWLSLIVDIVLGIFLLIGQNLARVIILIKLSLFFLLFTIYYIVSGAYPSIVATVGGYITLVILLMGRSTWRRIITSCFIGVLTIIGTVVYGVYFIFSPWPVEDYTTIQIDGMSSALPTDWQDSSSIYSGLFPEASEFDQYFTYESYIDFTGSVGVNFLIYNVAQHLEDEDYPWQGWEEFESDSDMSKLYLSKLYVDDYLSMYSNVVKLGSNIVTINFEECYEYLYTSELIGIPMRVNFLIGFGEDTMNIVVMVCEIADWSKFEECWVRIRDSIEIN
jgi:hypothetical protein